MVMGWSSPCVGSAPAERAAEARRVRNDRVPGRRISHTAGMLPTFEVDAHRLRPVRAEDAGVLGRHWDHREVRRFLFDGCAVSAADAQALVAECVADAERVSYGMWVIEPRRLLG